ncbi:MAG: ATP-binding protein, partial [Clostridiales bacterium]|nr:ATP-binding protein [Clostridiales bacterium]
YNALIIFMPLISFVIAIHYYKKSSKTKLEKVRKKILLISMTIPSISLILSQIIQQLHTDIILLGLMISGITLIISAYHYQIFDVGEKAKRQMLDTMTQALIILNENFGFIYANKKAMQLFPECMDAKIGLGMGNLYRKLCVKELKIDDRIYEVEMTIVYNGNELAGYSTCLFDVTERRRYEKELIKRKEESDFANQSKSTFLANVSHDIRTPLNAIIGMGVLALRNSLSDKLKYQIQSINHAAKELLQITDTILDISKLESGKVELLEEEYYLKPILYEVSNMAFMNLTGKKIAFHLEIQDTMPNGYIGDGNKVKQVLMNLLSNAIKYTKQGQISLYVSSRIVEDKNRLCFCVKDTGIGIHEKDIEKIFCTYERIHEEENQGIVGSGLGLSIVNSYVELMQGTITVKSDYGNGSEFTVEIPQAIFDSEEIGQLNLSENEIVAFLDEESVEAFHGIKFNGAKVLVVDDMEINLQVILGLLEPYEMKVDLSSTADEAIQLIQDNDYDLVFMDHMMPIKDGIEAIKEIRALPGSKYERLPVIMLSANAMAGMKEFFMDHGFQGFIPKPIDERNLLKVLQKWLSEYQRYTVIDQIDYEIGLHNVSNNQEQYIKILKTYEKEMRSLQEKLPLLAASDRDELRVKIHGIKGGSRSIGAIRLGDYAAAIEKKLKQADYDQLEENLRVLNEMMDQLLGNIRGFLNRQETDMKVQEPKTANEIDHEWWENLYLEISRYDSIQASQMIEKVLPQEDEALNQILKEILELLDIMEYDNCKKKIESYAF